MSSFDAMDLVVKGIKEHFESGMGIRSTTSAEEFREWNARTKELFELYRGKTIGQSKVSKARFGYIIGNGKLIELPNINTSAQSFSLAESPSRVDSLIMPSTKIEWISGMVYPIPPMHLKVSTPDHPGTIWLDHYSHKTITASFPKEDVVLIYFDFDFNKWQ